jgi:structural maintenance of chromosome 1
MIKKSGEMTGGSSGSLEAKASRFDAEEVEVLRADRQAAEEALARLRPVAALVDEEREAVARLARLERDAQYYAVDIKMASEKVQKFESEAANIERALNETLPALEAAERACAASRAAVEAVDAKVHAVEDEVYASFSQSVGVENIREYEAHNLATLQRSAEERAKFTQQRAKLSEQLNFERSRDVAGPKRRAEADIAKNEAELARLTGEGQGGARGLGTRRGGGARRSRRRGRRGARFARAPLRAQRRGRQDAAVDREQVRRRRGAARAARGHHRRLAHGAPEAPARGGGRGRRDARAACAGERGRRRCDGD